MASHYTSRYSLSQFDIDDDVVHTEFNENYQKIENAIYQCDQNSAGRAGTLQTQLTGTQSQLQSQITTAQSLLQGQIDTLAARTACRVVLYNGDGAASRTIDLGGPCTFVYVQSTTTGTYISYYAGLFAPSGTLFWASNMSNTSVSPISHLTGSGLTYPSTSDLNKSGYSYTCVVF